MTEPSKAIVQRPVGGLPEGKPTAPKRECPTCWAAWYVTRQLWDAHHLILIDNVVICVNGHAFAVDTRHPGGVFSLVGDMKTGEPIPVQYN